MADDTKAVVTVAEQAENVVANTLDAATEKVSVVAQTSGGFDIFGVPFWETLITFMIAVLIYDLFFRKLIAVTFNVKILKKQNALYYSATLAFFTIGSYLFCYFTDVSAGLLIRILFAVFIWTCAKYMMRFLDQYYVDWSKKRFGERTVAHNMVKDIAKRILIVIALLLTFVVLRISIVKFFSMEIPAYVGVFVLLPLLVRMNLLSFFSVINKGFIIGDFIQIGNDSDAISGTCLTVNFSGVAIQMVNGESVILKLARVADADVINYSTRLSHRCTRVYYLDIETDVAELREIPHNVKTLAKKYENVKMIQCNFISGAMYRHELKVVFDVHLDYDIVTFLNAKSVMDSFHLDILADLESFLARPLLQQS